MVLKWLKSRLMKHLCYAHDTILLLIGDSLKEVTMKIHRVVEALIEQLEKIGLALNLKKTEVLIYRRNRKHMGPVEIRLVGDNYIWSSIWLKYLGVILDDQLSWEWHLRYIRSKAVAMMPKLAAIAGNTFGYSSESREIMIEGTVWEHMCSMPVHAGHIGCL